MFHPIVEPRTGRVDMGALFPKWRADRDYASFVLPNLYRALSCQEYFVGNVRLPLNPAARELFLNDPIAFAERASECASCSLHKVYENVPGSLLQFIQGPVDAHDRILETFCKIDPSYT